MLRLASFRVAVVTSVILFVGVAAVVVAARVVNTGRPDDPFPALAVLMPGQPLSRVGNKYEFICDPYAAMISPNYACHVNSPPTGFRHLTFFVRDGIIDRLTIGGSGVTVGDLASGWGTDFRIQRQGDVRFIRWNGGKYVTVVADVPFRYFLPVKTVSFTQAWLPFS